PHLYKATQGDLRKLQEADIIFYNGLHLEGKMTMVFQKISSRKPVYPIAEGVSENRLIRSEQFQQAPDPHIWFDVDLWKEAVVFIKEKLKENDTLRADYYEENAAAYLLQL